MASVSLSAVGQGEGSEGEASAARPLHVAGSCGGGVGGVLGQPAETATSGALTSPFPVQMATDSLSPPRRALSSFQSLASQLSSNLSEQTSKLSSNAVSGAVAGTMVSMALHPVDTVKVLVQAHRGSAAAAGGASVSALASQFVATRGLLGLYSGILTNLASSAPISAVYTSSYEAVKEALRPLVPEHRAWVTHSIAGGCASVATSVIYTPSECVKQRMQVKVYPSTAHAFACIMKQDGVQGLYRGWTAVLARNIPQSAIKFFVFEQLRHRVCANNPDPGAGPTTAQTLAIGGISGSTAAVFTTPFDVIKTRFQTAAVTGGVRYSSVSHALTSIAYEEGLKGLFRGIGPRLLIYVTQGAIFFASYEMMKKCFKELAVVKAGGTPTAGAVSSAGANDSELQSP